MVGVKSHPPASSNEKAHQRRCLLYHQRWKPETSRFEISGKSQGILFLVLKGRCVSSSLSYSFMQQQIILTLPFLWETHPPLLRSKNLRLSHSKLRSPNLERFTITSGGSICLLKEWLLQSTSSTLSCIPVQEVDSDQSSHIVSAQWNCDDLITLAAYGEYILVWRNGKLFKFKSDQTPVQKSLRVILRDWLECDSFCLEEVDIHSEEKKRRERRKREESERWKEKRQIRRIVTRWTDASQEQKSLKVPDLCWKHLGH